MDPERFTNSEEKDLQRAKGLRYKECRFMRPNLVEEV